MRCCVPSDGNVAVSRVRINWLEVRLHWSASASASASIFLSTEHFILCVYTGPRPRPCPSSAFVSAFSVQSIDFTWRPLSPAISWRTRMRKRTWISVNVPLYVRIACSFNGCWCEYWHGGSMLTWPNEQLSSGLTRSFKSPCLLWDPRWGWRTQVQTWLRCKQGTWMRPGHHVGCDAGIQAFYQPSWQSSPDVRSRRGCWRC